MPYLGLRGAALARAMISLVVGPAFICYGYNLSVAGGLLTLLSFTKQFPMMDTIHVPESKQHFHSQIQGTVVALFTVGGIFGSLSCIWLGDRLGRRKMIFMMGGISIIGAILMSSSFSLGQFIVARLVLGVGTGGYLATVPVWQSEISLAHKRGAHVVTDGIFVGIGTALALFIDLGMYFVPTNSVSWRFPLAFQVSQPALIPAVAKVAANSIDLHVPHHDDLHRYFPRVAAVAAQEGPDGRSAGDPLSPARRRARLGNRFE